MVNRKNISSLYSISLGEPVIAQDTILKGLLKKLDELVPEHPQKDNYTYFYRQFQKHDHFHYEVGDKKYFFQRIVKEHKYLLPHPLPKSD